METFRISTVPGPGSCTMTLHGEADLAVAGDIVELGRMRLGEPATHTLVIDLEAVTFMDSSGISALIQLRNLARRSGKHVLLAQVPARVRQLLAITGLDDVFALHADRTGAPDPQSFPA